MISGVVGNIILGVIATIVGAVLCQIGSRVYRRFQESQGIFTGEWEQIIFDEIDKTKIVKRDMVKCRQREEIVRGIIQRKEPSEQAHRKWYFLGRYRGQLFFGIFWSVLPEDPSYGTLQLRHIEENRFVGFYVRLKGIEEKDDRVTKFTEELKSIPFEWQKKS